MVLVLRVTILVHAESFKGTPGIFDDNDAELTSDQLLKLGLAGPSSRGGGGGGGHKGGQGSGKGGKGKGGEKGDEAKHCFHCHQKVNISPVSFPRNLHPFSSQGHMRPQCPLWQGNGGGKGGPGKKSGNADAGKNDYSPFLNFIPHILYLI